MRVLRLKTIWKFDLGAVPDQLPAVRETTIPVGARVLHVGIQRSAVCLWASVDTEQPGEVRRIVLVGTGQTYPSGLFYAGTIQVRDSWVLHLFLERSLLP